MARVLLVDDSTIDRRVAEEILQEADHEVLLASDGRQALDLVREQAPDVIVTDLQMPNLDGLGLVTSLQIESPSIPVILMTAHGSEDMANQALRSGATSYVPKSELSRLLQSSVETILSAVHREQTYAQLIGYAERAAFHFSLDNDPELIEPLVDLIQQMIRNVCEIDETE
ncbi:MAG TPA: response regulator, partial [Planctomycetes bacterium]|nr:response regulator [Planctomycetota bacterium]